jgi:UDP-glucuronate decarboxylase
MRRHPPAVCVAGGAGFIGSHLCAAWLAEGRRVLCLDSFLTGSMENIASLLPHPQFRLIRHDATHPVVLDEPVDLICNLLRPAPPDHPAADPVQALLTHVLGTRYLLAVAAVRRARFLHVTGIEGASDPGRALAEQICRDAQRKGTVDARIARIGSTYGPHMRDDGIVGYLVTRALAGDALRIAPNQPWSGCHVSDIVAGLLALGQAQAAPAAPVAFAHPETLSQRDLAAELIRLLPRRPQIVTELHPRPRPHASVDIALARSQLGWQPRVPLTDGLRATVDWFTQARPPAPQARA